MQMDPGEIARIYRASADKRLQIGILAELNLCTKDEIVEVLKGQGIPDKELPKARKRKETGAVEGRSALDKKKDAASGRKSKGTPAEKKGCSS